MITHNHKTPRIVLRKKRIIHKCTSSCRPVVNLILNSTKKSKKNPSRTTVFRDCASITKYLAGLARGDATRAGASLVHVLKSNNICLPARSKIHALVKRGHSCAETEMVKIIKYFLTDHQSKGTRKRIHQNAIDAILSSVCWEPSTITTGKISRLNKDKAALIGVPRKVITDAMRQTKLM
jgi:hypothetical protein